jgi:hypothetical protein
MFRPTAYGLLHHRKLDQRGGLLLGSYEHKLREGRGHRPSAEAARPERRRTGIEPARGLVALSSVLKTEGPTRNPDASGSELSRGFARRCPGPSVASSILPRTERKGRDREGIEVREDRRGDGTGGSGDGGGADGIGQRRRRHPQGRLLGPEQLDAEGRSGDGRLEVEFEVDSNVNGQTWRVRVFQDGDRIFAGRRETRGPSGSFELEFRTRNRAGTDRFRARAVNPATDEVCVGRVSF